MRVDLLSTTMLKTAKNRNFNFINYFEKIVNECDKPKRHRFDGLSVHRPSIFHCRW